MRISKRGATSTLNFIIGLIIAVMTILFFAQVAYPFIIGSDPSVDGVDSMANTIMSVVKSQKAYAEYVKLKIKQDEMVLFFDNNTENFVFVVRDDDRKTFENGPFPLYDQKYDLKYFLDKNHFVDYYIFERPRDCGDKACIVLCRNANVTRHASIKFKFDDKKDYLIPETRPNDIFLIKCDESDSYIRNVEGINKFYRKPYFQFNYLIEGFNSAFINGVVLRTAIFDNLPTKEDKEKKLEFFSGYKYHISERKQYGWTELFLAATDSPVYVQPFGNDVVICYKSPCLDKEDEVYLDIKNTFDLCMKDPNLCKSLIMTIEQSYDINKEPVIFEAKDNKFHYKYGEKDYVFDYDLEMYYTMEYRSTLETDDLGPFSDITFEVKRLRLPSNSFDIVVIKLGSKTHVLSKISYLPADETDKARLLFYLGEEFPEPSQ